MSLDCLDDSKTKMNERFHFLSCSSKGRHEWFRQLKLSYIQSHLLD